MVFGTWRAVVFSRNYGDKGAAAQSETITNQTPGSSLFIWLRNWQSAKNQIPVD